MLVASIRRTGARVSIRLLPEIYTAAAKLIKEHLDDRRISISEHDAAKAIRPG